MDICPTCFDEKGIEVELIYQRAEWESLSGRATVQQYSECIFCPECDEVFNWENWGNLDE